MQDDKARAEQEGAQEERKPDTASIREGIRALLAGNPNFTDNPKLINEPIHGPRDSEGRMIVTYTTDIGEPHKDFTMNVDNRVIKPVFSPMSQNAQAMRMLRRSIAEIEAVANVKFVAVDASDKQKMEDSNIRFIVANDMGARSGGHPAMEQKIGPNQSEVIIDSHVLTRAYLPGVNHRAPGHVEILHETLHSLGLTHPEAQGSGRDGGLNPDYSGVGTIMSYDVKDAHVQGLGPYDVATLQLLYGEPDTKNIDHIIDENEVTTTSTLYSPETPATIDISKTQRPGQIVADLSSRNYREQFTGAYNQGNGQSWAPIQIRLSEESQIKNVYSGHNVSLDITGNELENHFIGAKNRDNHMRPRDGSDTMTGGDFFDTYILDSQSGTGNVITNFRSWTAGGRGNSDVIYVGDDIKSVAVTYDTQQQAPKMEFKDADGKVVADVALQGLSLAEAREQAAFIIHASNEPQHTRYVADAGSVPRITIEHNEEQDRMYDALEQVAQNTNSATSNPNSNLPHNANTPNQNRR